MATVELTTNNFEQLIMDNPLVLVDFWARWCLPCQRFAPIYEAASLKHPEVMFATIDTETQQELAARFAISSIPTLMAFREQVIVYAQPGALEASQLDQLVAAVKKLDMAEVRSQIAAEQLEQNDERS